MASRAKLITNIVGGITKSNLAKIGTISLTDVFKYDHNLVSMMNILNAARLNPPKEGHKHHIIPRCWFKMNNLQVDNSKENLVLLSPEDHVKVHILSILCGATPEMRSKMGFAVHRLLEGSFSGLHHTDATKQIIRAKRAEQVITYEHKQHISEGLKGKSKPPRTKSHCEALSKALKGHKWDKSVIEQRGISNRHPKSNNANYQKAQKSLSVAFHRYKDEGGELKWQQWLHFRSGGKDVE